MYAIGSNSGESSVPNSGRCSAARKHASRKLKHARILLAADGGASDEADGVGSQLDAVETSSCEKDRRHRKDYPGLNAPCDHAGLE
ncbi:hypothetical protein [Bradyrhizobium diazoefficiens]